MTPMSLWISAGLLLIVSELIVPGFVICFFGVAALIMGGIVAIFHDIPLTVQGVVFIVLSVALILMSRRFLPRTFAGKSVKAASDPDSDDVAGAQVKVTKAITPGQIGRVEFRGTIWEARSETEHQPGDTATIVSRENLILLVR